jgi:hypothetical protein
MAILCVLANKWIRFVADTLRVETIFFYYSNCRKSSKKRKWLHSQCGKNWPQSPSTLNVFPYFIFGRLIS